MVFLGINLYAIDWELGIQHEENTKYLVSASASVIGAMVVLVMNMWRKLSVPA